MIEQYKKYRECQNCKRVFIVPKVSSNSECIFCTFCGNENVAIITKKQYDDSYYKNER